MSQPDYRAQTMVVKLEHRVLALENQQAGPQNTSAIFDSIRMRCSDDGAVKEVKLRLDTDNNTYTLQIVQ